MIREFKLINEKGQDFSFMDIHNYCLLTEPSGLGYSYSTEYQQLGYTFIESLRKLEKGQLSGTVNFVDYENYYKLVDFIENSEELRFLYKIPYRDGRIAQYYKDVLLQSLSKTEKQTNGILSESIVFDCLNLWYEENTTIHKIEPLSDEIRWDFRWDSRFSDYNTRSVPYINKGHTEAVVKIEMDGYLENPKIELYVEGQLYQTIPFHVTIEQYEKLLYDSRENHFAIEKKNTDGTKSSLFNLDVIEFENDNVLRLPKNRSCEIRLTADNEVLNAEVSIYSQYKAV